jgi:hypothetical protein
MEADDGLDGAQNLCLVQGRTAAYGVPAQQELRHHLWIDPIVQEMAGQGGDAAVSLSLRHPLAQQAPPVGEGVAMARVPFRGQLAKPRGQRHRVQHLR